MDRSSSEYFSDLSTPVLLSVLRSLITFHSSLSWSGEATIGQARTRPGQFVKDET